MKIDPDSSADLSAQIATAIRDEIIAGRLIVDARLPSEAELADHFNVSRPTVREALRILERWPVHPLRPFSYPPQSPAL